MITEPITEPYAKEKPGNTHTTDYIDEIKKRSKKLQEGIEKQYGGGFTTSKDNTPRRVPVVGEALPEFDPNTENTPGYRHQKTETQGDASNPASRQKKGHGVAPEGMADRRPYKDKNTPKID